MDIWKVKYEKLLEQFNAFQVAYDAKCDELEMLRAMAGDNVRIYGFGCLFLVFYSFACCRQQRRTLACIYFGFPMALFCMPASRARATSEFSIIVASRFKEQKRQQL